jgi:hypothetical protein
MADEKDWLRGERAFRGQPRASRRGRDRSATRDAGHDAEYRAEGGSAGRSGHDFGRGYERDHGSREPYGQGAGRGYLRGRGTESGADSGHPGLGRARRSDFFRLHGRAGIEEGRRRDEAAGGQGAEDFASQEPHHQGHSPSDPRPCREAGRSGRMSDEDVHESVHENLFQDSFNQPGR